MQCQTFKFITMYWLWYILVGLVAGWLAGIIVKGSGGGLIVNIIVGIIGSVLGGWLFSFLGLVAQNKLGSLITATAGAIVLLLIVNLITHKSSKKKVS